MSDKYKCDEKETVNIGIGIIKSIPLKLLLLSSKFVNLTAMMITIMMIVIRAEEVEGATEVTVWPLLPHQGMAVVEGADRRFSINKTPNYFLNSLIIKFAGRDWDPGSRPLRVGDLASRIRGGRGSQV